MWYVVFFNEVTIVTVLYTLHVVNYRVYIRGGVGAGRFFYGNRATGYYKCIHVCVWFFCKTFLEMVLQWNLS